MSEENGNPLLLIGVKPIVYHKGTSFVFWFIVATICGVVTLKKAVPARGKVDPGFLPLWACEGGGLVLHVPIKIDYKRQPKGRTIRKAEALIKGKGRDRIGHSEKNIMYIQMIVQQKALEILFEFTKVVIEILVY